jgi:hypothetical protein
MVVWLTGREPGYPPVSRWERVLHAEQSLAHRLLPALARRPRLRKLLRIPTALAEPPENSLHSREKRVNEIRRTPIGLALDFNRAQPVRSTVHPRPGRPPRLGPTLAQEVDRAIEVLRHVPFEELQRRGWHLVRNNFASPLNDLDFLRANPHLWLRPRWPTEIDLDLDSQEELMRRLGAHAGELPRALQAGDWRVEELIWDAGTFAPGDAYAYYGLVRKLKPRRVVEVGAGHSSIVLARAVAANGDSPKVTLIEPNPSQPLFEMFPKDWKIVPDLVQDVGFEPFERLEAGDMLFYDGSHCVRTASDVNWMFFEVFPRLQRGVWIHVHDIFWPLDYPVGWVLDNALAWNEQYLLQAFLMYNDQYRVRLALAALMFDRSERLEQLFPAGTLGGSVWLEKV